MFGFLKPKEKVWLTENDFYSDLRKHSWVAEDNEITQRLHFENNFEKFTKVLESLQKTWVKTEKEFMPGIHSSPLDCITYGSLLEDNGVPKYLIEVSKQIVNEGTFVCIIDAFKCGRIFSSLLRAVLANYKEKRKVQLDGITNENAIDTIEFLNKYRDSFFPELFNHSENVIRVTQIKSEHGGAPSFVNKTYLFESIAKKQGKIGVTVQIHGANTSVLELDFQGYKLTEF